MAESGFGPFPQGPVLHCSAVFLSGVGYAGEMTALAEKGRTPHEMTQQLELRC